MSPIAPALESLSRKIADLTGRLGRRVDVAAMNVTDRAGDLKLAPPGLVSPNGTCRLIRAADGWIAVNLARDEDRGLLSAWLKREVGADVWEEVAQGASARDASDLIDNAALLGLPVAQVGEIAAQNLAPPSIRMASAAEPKKPRNVVDLSALWAGPLCGAIFAEMDVDVVKVESVRRPDPVRVATPSLDMRLNGRKTRLSLDLSNRADQSELRARILAADVLITSARPRTFPSLGLEAHALFAENPGLIWVAITGYGWTGPGAARVAFGDDAAAAGGLVHWTQEGPRFIGDALADPITGLAAAIGALEAVEAGGGVLIDAAMARCAAAAAVESGLKNAA
jgi:hypothetical protein